jgi:hypothetical protein
MSLVHGHKIDLEERTCVNGCGLTFKVMPNSSQVTARSDCDRVCKKNGCVKQSYRLQFRPPPPSAILRKTKPMSRLDSVDNKIEEMKLNNWLHCVRNADKFKMNRSFEDKMEIASWAITAVNFRYSDSADKIKKDAYEKFAKDIDIKPECLNEWVLVKSKLQPVLGQLPLTNTTVLAVVAPKVRAGMKKDVILAMVSKEQTKHLAPKIAENVKKLKEIRDFFCDSNIVEGLDLTTKKGIVKPVNDLYTRVSNAMKV